MGAIVVVAIVAASAFAWRSQRRRGVLDAMVPLDAETAIAVAHDSSDGTHPRGSLALVERDGTVRWTQPLAELLRASERGGLGVGGGIATVQFQRFEAGVGSVELHGYDVATGERRWEVPVEEPDASFAQTRSGDDLLLTLTMRGEITAIDRATGTIRWRGSPQEQDRAGFSIRRAPAHVVLESSDSVDFFALADGARTHLDTRGPGCLVGSSYVTLVAQGDEGGQALVELSPDAPAAARTLAASVQLDVAGESGMRLGLHACATYGELVVLLVQREDDAGGVHLALLAIDRRSGETAFTLDLEASWRSDGSRRAGGRGSFSGELSRFVPLLLGDNSQGHAVRMATVDIERRVVRRSAPLADLEGCELLRAGSRYHYLGGQCTATYRSVAVIDGATGTLVGAREGASEVRVADPAPNDGHLWVFERTDAGWEHARWAVLDVATLAPVGHPALELSDATDRIATTLGLEVSGRSATHGE